MMTSACRSPRGRVSQTKGSRPGRHSHWPGHMMPPLPVPSLPWSQSVHRCCEPTEPLSGPWTALGRTGVLTPSWDSQNRGHSACTRGWVWKGSLTLSPQRPELGVGAVPGPCQRKAGGFLFRSHLTQFQEGWTVTYRNTWKETR